MTTQDHKTATEPDADEYDAECALADTAHWDANGQVTALYYAEIAAACKASYNAAVAPIENIFCERLDK